ncbi:hypothetical protein COV49_03300 [Candidatus Falkowbacteria bacterium CG11_big_fil_rev_8_21_14_0_20_39_10]|uniref:AAA+ ATPase domain-containing protein n=1 Tax=Candidatus Falkowbacteria bacterium CG11_big_fil_rev_8_21_14_0_20_39_10 TaxID=1974570 RepID=A0A2M6K8U1_9BACT|nr:MAG: hypothetical protein COV49_03300 [Candidatus Falkowbacteria bacterium CG11_big_fil_rev_8_21_14_0_20_39_10]
MRIAYYDLKLEAAKNRLPNIVGRREEMKRLARIISRQIYNNCLIIGPEGIGKTSLVHSWVKKMSGSWRHKNTKFIQLEAESFLALGETKNSPFGWYQEVLDEIPTGVLFVDDFGLLLQNKTAFYAFARLFKPFLESPKNRVVLTINKEDYKWLEKEEPGWLNSFEIINLKNQPAEEQIKILSWCLKYIIPERRLKTSKENLELIVKRVQRFPTLGQMPAGAIKLLDESLSLAKLQNKKILTNKDIEAVVADKTGIPLSQLQANEKEMLKNLESNLNKEIISQGQAIAKISSTIQRAKLGLRNANRPLGSFLVLGPSGVGKTETAKMLARIIFGRPESFTRIDMSEFGQEHTVQRLTGAPPGYVGYDQGGGLTNPVKEEPYSLILLDEIEKAHPKVFDIFLQVLDDGRLTSGQGETVDFTQTIIMATSNLAVSEILAGWESSDDIHSNDFLKSKIFPVLTSAFRPEFLNRFDNIVIFNPLSSGDLMSIAQLEIKKIEERVSEHNFKFNIDPKILSKKIEELTDYRFGARPVKRFIEDVCETLITKNLLK